MTQPLEKSRLDRFMGPLILLKLAGRIEVSPELAAIGYVKSVRQLLFQALITIRRTSQDGNPALPRPPFERSLFR
jgi:hypothetical protein